MEEGADLGTMTMREIDLFENRLQLKTLQEGLKHKVASIDQTPSLVHGAVEGGVGDYTAKFAGSASEPSSQSLPRAEAESSLGASLAATDQEEPTEETIPEIYPPKPPPEPVPEVKLAARVLQLDILHASALQSAPNYWQSGVASMLCHPYCITTYNNQVVRGKTVPNSRNPVIKESLTLYAPRTGPLGHVTISLYSEEPSGSTQADTLIGAASFDVAEKLRASENKAADGAGGDVHQWLPLDGGVSGSLHVSLRMEDVPEA